MKDRERVFTRYDLIIVEKHRPRRISEDDVLQELADCLVDGDEQTMEQLTMQALRGRSPEDIIQRGLLPGMREVSRLWEIGTYFLPQVILSADAMIAGIALCEREMGTSVTRKAKVVTHTAEGDIHDIGQTIVNVLLNAAGFEVINLGADVPVEEVVEACRIHRPILLTGTALMTTTMTAFPRISRKLRQSDLVLPFVCGGGAVSEEFVTSFELGIWGKEASQAPAMAEDALAGLSWQEMRARWNG